MNVLPETKATVRWHITLLKGTQAKFLGYVETADEKAAIEAAAKEFKIVLGAHQNEQSPCAGAMPRSVCVRVGGSSGDLLSADELPARSPERQCVRPALHRTTFGIPADGLMGIGGRRAVSAGGGGGFGRRARTGTATASLFGTSATRAGARACAFGRSVRDA